MPTDFATKSEPVGEGDREGEGVLRRKSLLMSKSKGSPIKVYPGLQDNSKGEARLEKKSSKYTKAPTQAQMTPRVQTSVIVPGVLAVAVLTCLCWTLGLILLNIAPNDTVNRVMNTATFDYGSFWLMADPPKALVITATLGLVMVAVGYLGVVIKMINCRRSLKQAYLVHQVPDKVDFLKKVEKALDDAAARPPRGKIASTIVKLAAALAREDSVERKRSVSSLYQERDTGKLTLC